MEDDDNYVEHITEDVLTVLIGKRFFEALDEQMCPVDSAMRRAQCTGSYALATTVLARLRFDSDDIADILVCSPRRVRTAITRPCSTSRRPAA